MSYLDRIALANRFDLKAFVPFFIGSTHVGWIRHRHLDLLRAWPDVFAARPRRVDLAPGLLAADPRVRSEALAEVCRSLHADGVFGGWRDEPYVVSAHFNAPALLTLERAAVPFFGVVAYGVHLNGYVGMAADAELQMWVARRAYDKPTAPGELDQVVAGGQPHGIGLMQNLVKECAEEASIPAELAARARPVGAISYVYETPLGLRPDVLFCYDLCLPADFVPVNTDGEVHDFERRAIEDVMRVVHDTDEFKFNCALVVIDFLIRHGHLDPEHPEYTALVRGLHGGNTTPLPAFDD